MHHSRRLLLAVACLALASGGVIAQAAKDKDAPPKVAAQGAKPEVGEITQDFTFKSMVNGDGRMSLKELRGNVVLIDWWGYH